MSFGTLALIGLCSLAGPLLAAAGKGAVPVVVGELLAGILLGQSGLKAIDPSNATLSFMAEIGFAMLMFAVGMSVPLRQQGLRESLGKGATTAALVALLAIGGGLIASRIGGAGHPAVYAVLIASGSAAVVLPIGAMIAVPLVLAPGRTGRIVAGSLVVAISVFALSAAARRVRTRSEVRELRRLGKKRGWAVDLRLALIVLFGLAWLTERSGASLLIAGFGAGLTVATIGGPKRLSNEVLGIAGGFFIPLFFVVLGARLDLGGLFSDPALIGLAGALVGINVLVHLIAARIVRQPRASGLVASAQLGVPSALVALGLPAHVLTATQAAAIIVAALGSIGVCSVGALGLEREHESAPESL
jgi:Kef-type K+ transport system membrane component KefB